MTLRNRTAIAACTANAVATKQRRYLLHKGQAEVSTPTKVKDTTRGRYEPVTHPAPPRILADVLDDDEFFEDTDRPIFIRSADFVHFMNGGERA